ncbi:hypothetical protein ALC62_07903, partial [Cyphomyrmex costatus]
LFSVPLVNISVVEGRPAELPCDITPPGEDTLHMVFWFKDEAGVPLYTAAPMRCNIDDTLTARDAATPRDEENARRGRKREKEEDTSSTRKCRRHRV